MGLSEPIKLYHFTHAENLPSIRERGLVPAPLTAVCDQGHGKAVWLTRSPDRTPTEGTTTVTLDLFDRRLCSDPEQDPLFMIPAWFIYRGTISPDKIEFPVTTP
ncbi:MAG TPA: hypothetical protein VMV59_07070 [Candidatus Dormibacteraeota bacterium]|nr:hypothetical protein [Candidatus Dormibacteraeota bacterium]